MRQQEGRGAAPSAGVIDAQSVKTSTSVPARSQGIDAGKKTSDAEELSSDKGQVGFPSLTVSAETPVLSG